MKKFILLTIPVLCAILCFSVSCCEKSHAKAERSENHTWWKAEINVPYVGGIQIYEVEIDGQPYLVTTGYHCVNTIPKTMPPQVAERAE